MELYVFLISVLTFGSVALFVYASYRMLKELQQVPIEDERLLFGLEAMRHRQNLFYRTTMFGVRVLARLNVLWNLGGYEESLRKKLDAAGRPFDLKPMEFLALNEISAMVFGVLGVLFSLSLPGGSVFVVLLMAGLGFFLPNFYLNALTEKRQFYILRDLPFCCDLLTLAVEAGLDFGSALERVVANGPPGPLRDELKLTVQESRLGKSRRDALGALSDRAQMVEISHFVGAIVQADRMGTGFASVLRIQSAQIRARRFERAEKVAQKVPVKILFPMIVANLLSIGIILIVPLLSTIGEMGL